MEQWLDSEANSKLSLDQQHRKYYYNFFLIVMEVFCFSASKFAENKPDLLCTAPSAKWLKCRWRAAVCSMMDEVRRGRQTNKTNRDRVTRGGKLNSWHPPRGSWQTGWFLPVRPLYRQAANSLSGTDKTNPSWDLHRALTLLPAGRAAGLLLFTDDDRSFREHEAENYKEIIRLKFVQIRLTAE